ncbi:MAG TPA: hypothetical protein VK525_18795 [Candidatus Saccharimonadales bacterium]|nr:hypothetical protein [Candidatus Saccharimonadales bacterium]
MANTQVRRAPLWDFLEEQHLTRRIDAPELARVRSLLESSPVPDMLRETAGEINRKVGSVVIEAHTYLPPEQLVCSFTYVKGNVEHIMQLEVNGAKPSLVFLTRKWRTGFSSRIIDWTYRFFDAGMSSIQVKSVSTIDLESVSKEETESWFIYLLSGMRRGDFPPSLEYGEI